MKLVLRVLAFSLCLVATFSAASFSSPLASAKPHLTGPTNSVALASKPQPPSAPMPTCNPALPWCSM